MNQQLLHRPLLKAPSDESDLIRNTLRPHACSSTHPNHTSSPCLSTAPCFTLTQSGSESNPAFVFPTCSAPAETQAAHLYLPKLLCVASTNTRVSLSVPVDSAARRRGATTVGSPRGTSGSGRTPRPPPPPERANQRRVIFTPLPCCLLAPTFWWCG